MIACQNPSSPSPIQSLGSNGHETSYLIQTLTIEGLLKVGLEWSTCKGLPIALAIENEASSQWIKCIGK